MPLTTSKTKPRHSWQFEAIGTQWSIETLEALGEIKDIISDRIEVFDRTYSRFRDDSLVTSISKTPGVYELPNDGQSLMRFYRDLYDATDGAVSPLVGSVLEAAGYDKSYSLQPSNVEAAPAWDDVLGWNDGRLETKQPIVLDFGAAGKGYLIDIVAELLERHGHADYLIDASGDIRVRGNEQTIGLENPYDSSRVIGLMTVKNASVCASATNRRAWGEWHHILDPRTAKPVSEIVATWVVASSTMQADGLATALFFVQPEKLSQWQFTFLRLLHDGSIERSDDFVGELYI